MYDTGSDKWTYESKMFDSWHVYLGPCPGCGKRTYDYGGNWRCLAQYCYYSANNPTPSVGKRPSWWGTGIQVKMDGDQWCATQADFINLQESPAGFGDSPKEAVDALLVEVSQ